MQRSAFAPVLLVALSIPASLPAEEAFRPLFDGKSLAGWSVQCKTEDRPCAEKFWRVDRGAILADSMGHKDHDYVWLVTDAEFGDFVLRLRFQAERGIPGNSGVQVRSRYDRQAGYLDGPQIDINPPGPWRTGMMWDETRGAQGWLYPRLPKGKWVDESMAPKGLKFVYAEEGSGWNDFEISAQGLRIRAWLNGGQVTDFDGTGILNDPIHQQRKVGRQGAIALQIHIHDELRIRFKDLRIREGRQAEDGK